jgi:hypothetical protein
MFSSSCAAPCESSRKAPCQLLRPQQQWFLPLVGATRGPLVLGARKLSCLTKLQQQESVSPNHTLQRQECCSTEDSCFRASFQSQTLQLFVEHSLVCAMLC